MIACRLHKLIASALLLLEGLSCPAAAAAEGTVQLTIGAPSVVVRAPVGERRWGRWQFPGLERLGDGRLHASWHVQEDSAAAYGASGASAVSADEGRTWTPVETTAAETLAGGTLLPNGDRLKLLSEKSLPLKGLQLPEPAGEGSYNYGNVKHRYYRSEDFPGEIRRSFPQVRMAAGETTWVREYPKVTIPGQLLTARDGVLARPFFMGLLVTAPDGSLWTSCYWQRMKEGKITSFLPTFVRSDDLGRTWNFMSDIPYQPDKSADPHWERRDGFTEPEIAFLPDGSLFALLRTTDGEGTGPLYSAASADGGKSWSRPEVFDSVGVLPQLLVLKNGVTLASYGRPKLFVRATADKGGKKWDQPREISLHPAPWAPWGATCAYTRLLPAGENSALLIYSDFGFPDEEGRPRKTILVSRITASIH